VKDPDKAIPVYEAATGASASRQGWGEVKSKLGLSRNATPAEVKQALSETASRLLHLPAGSSIDLEGGTVSVKMAIRAEDAPGRPDGKGWKSAKRKLKLTLGGSIPTPPVSGGKLKSFGDIKKALGLGNKAGHEEVAAGLSRMMAEKFDAEVCGHDLGQGAMTLVARNNDAS